jgi:glucose dehydrogenase
MSKESVGEFHVEVKRFYIPFKFNLECPSCGYINGVDLEDRYLSYPVANKVVEDAACCEECCEEIPYNLTLKIDVEVSSECVVDSE